MAKKSETGAISPNTLALYDKLVATVPGVERKGATVPYTSYNGHMFSYLNKDGVLALKLPEPIREKFLTKYKTTLAEAYGIVQKEYVAVPATLLENTRALKPYFNASFEYVKALKPKPTTKRKKAGK